MYRIYCNLGATVIKAPSGHSWYFSLLNIAPNVDGIIFRWRFVITTWYLVPYATVITKRHSNNYSSSKRLFNA